MDLENTSRPDAPIFDADGNLSSTYKKPIGFWEGFAIAIIVIIAQLLAAIISLLVAIPMVGMDIDRMMPIIMGVTLIISFPLAVWLVFRKWKLESTAWHWNSKFWVLIPICIFLMYSINYLVGSFLEMLPNYEELMEQYTAMFENLNPTLLIIGGAFIGPVCEEIIFRGIILKEFLRRYTPTKAILLSALIFGLIHMVPIQVFSAGIIGIVLGYVYYRTRSLWLVIIMHVINNLVAFIIGVDAEANAGETIKEWFNNDALYLGSFLLAAAIAYGMYLLFEKVLSKDDEKTITQV